MHAFFIIHKLDWQYPNKFLETFFRCINSKGAAAHHTCSFRAGGGDAKCASDKPLNHKQHHTLSDYRSHSCASIVVYRISQSPFSGELKQHGDDVLSHGSKIHGGPHLQKDGCKSEKWGSLAPCSLLISIVDTVVFQGLRCGRTLQNTDKERTPSLCA